MIFYGNSTENVDKGITCIGCTMEIHGTPKIPTWNFLSATVNAGSNEIVTEVTTNWEVGDLVVIATTDF